MSDDTFTGADFEAAASSAAASESVAPDTTPAASTETAATAPAGESVTPPPSTETPAGPIPFAVHKTALDNARTKAVEEWKQQYGYAEHVPREQFQAMSQWYARAHADPVAFAQELISELQQHPEHGAKLRSMAARALQQGRSQQPASTLPVIQLEDGTQVDLNALKAQWAQEVEQKFAPDLATARELKAEREQIAQKAAADTFARDFLSEVRTLPNFSSVEPQIKTELAKLIQAGQVGDHPAELRDAVRALYLRIALPQLQSTERRAVLHDINQKAHAGTVQPGMTGVRPPKSMDEMSIAEALAHTASTMQG